MKKNDGSQHALVTKLTSKNIIVVLFLSLMLLTIVLWAAHAPFPLASDEIADLARSYKSPSLDDIQYGPLYSLNYYVLMEILPNPLMAFYTKQVMVLLAVGVLLFSLARAFDLKPVIAAGISLWSVVVLLDFNGTSEFAFVLALAGCLSVTRHKQWGWFGFFVLLSLAFLVRTEYILGLFMGILSLSQQMIADQRHQRLRDTRSSQVSLLVGVGLLVLCITAYLFVRAPAEYDRSWFAFGQHFALNYKQWNALPGNPWIEWERFVAFGFPNSGSISEAVRENPTMFARHIGFNLLFRLPAALFKLIVPPVITEPRSLLVTGGIGGLIVTLTILVGSLGVYYNELRARQFRLLLMLAVIPIFSLLIMPISRHLLPLMPLIVVLIGKGLTICWEQNSAGLKGVVQKAMLLVIVAIVSGVSLAANFRSLSSDSQPSIRYIFSELRDEVIPVRLLGTAAWRVCALTGTDSCVSFDVPVELLPDESLSTYAQRQQVNWFLVLGGWSSLTQFEKDPLMGQFLAQPQQFGCTAGPMTIEKFQLIGCPSSFNFNPVSLE